MERLLNNIVFKLFQLVFLLSQAGCQPSGYEKAGDSTVHYYAIEVNGTLCGYAEVSETPVIREGLRLIMQENNTHISMNLMGRRIETYMELNTFIDSVTSRPVANEVKIDQGNVHIHSRMNVNDTLVQFFDVNKGDEANMVVPREVIIDNSLYYPYLVKDFYKTGLSEKTYSFLDERERKISKKTFTYKGMDTLFLAGREHICMFFTEVGSNGMISKNWIDPVTGLQLRNDIPGGGRNVYLADYRIKEMISTIDIDNVLFYTVNRVIPDFKKMTYMKVEVEINTVGDSLSVEKLNRKGQHFEGVIENNFVIGTFELEPVNYDGRNAPGFPYDYKVQEGMNKYLEPENLIESDDIEIIHFARQVTKDETDAWEAAVKLSRWVSDNISGAIPGGGTAKGTLDLRQAECGGHSRLLTALCRAAGIPARFVMGGMYVPDNGGFFGQHAWVEVFMGEAGWIPVDATIDEVDYIDAGHIRLGEKSTFHPKKMEIVEYKVQ